MTQIKVDTIANAAGTGAADFADGITIAGGALSALNTAEYYSSASEPTSPKNGAIWWDTANEKVMVYIAGEFKEVELGAAAAVVFSWTFDASDLTQDSNSLAVGSQDTNPYSVAVSATGDKMFLVGLTGDSVFQYSLSTPFDITTATYDSVSFSLASQETSPADIKFNADGTKMFIIGFATDSIYQYSLSTAYDASTISYDNVSFSVSSQETYPMALYFTPDGTKMYVGGRDADRVHQYSLSTAFDVSTASYDNVSLDISSKEASLTSIFFDTAGEKLFILGYTSDSFHQYNLSSAYDLTTASFVSTLATPAGALGASVSPDGTKVYVTNTSTPDSVYQYSTGL